MVKIGTCQMTSGSDIETNLQVAERLIRQAASQGCALVSLPEMFAIMPQHAKEALAAADEFGGGPGQGRIAKLA